MGNGASRVIGCFVAVGNRRDRDRVGLHFSEPLDEGLGHSFCYVRPVIESSHITPSQSERFSVEPALLDSETLSTQSRSFRLSQELAVDGTPAQRPSKNVAETTFKSISGASVSANASTPRTVATNDQYNSFANGPHDRAAAFESTASFSSLPLQPVPRGIIAQSGPVAVPPLLPLDKGLSSGPAERGFTSGPLERGGFMSGPLERGTYMSGPLENIDRTHFSAPLTYDRKKRSIGHFVRNMGKPVRKALSRTLSKTSSTLVRTQRSLVTPVMHFVGWQPKEGKYSAKDVDTFYNPNVDMSFMSAEGDYHSQNIQWAQGKAGEDRVHVVLSEEHGWLFVGIYDGFNGPDAPDFLMSNLYRAVNKELRGLLWDCEVRDGFSTGNKFGAKDLDCESWSFSANQENAHTDSFGGIPDNAKVGSSGQLQQSADNGSLEGDWEKAENGSFKVAVQKKGCEQCCHRATLKEMSKTDEHKIEEQGQETRKMEDKGSVKQHQDLSTMDGEELVTSGSALDSANKARSECAIECYMDVTSGRSCEVHAGWNDLSRNTSKALNDSQGDSLGLVQKVDFYSRSQKTTGKGRRGKCLHELLAEEDDFSDFFTWKPTTGILSKCHWDMPHFTEKLASRDVAPAADLVAELDGTEEKGSDRFLVHVDTRGGNGADGQISEHTLKVSFSDSQQKQGINRSFFGSKQRQMYTNRKVICKKLFPWKFDWEREQIEADPKLDESFAADNGKLKANAVDHVAVLKALARALEATEEAYLEMADKVLDENPELALMGSCVLVMLMKDEDVYIMNLGDSRAILAQKRPDVYERHLNPSRMCQSNFEKDDERERSDVKDSLRRLELEQIIEEPLADSENIEASHSSNNVELSAHRVKLSALQLSTDHSTSIEEEVLRIKVEHLDDNQSILNDRVKGQLKVTRAFGAGFLKQPKWNNALLEVFRIDYVGTAPYITCAPSVCHHRLGPNDHFLVLSSDGLYQYLSNEEVVSHVGWFMEKFPDGDPAQSLIEELLFRAAKKNGMDFHELLDIPQGDRRKYHDDVSVMVISLEGRIWKSSG